jgi:hypothetical protein
MRFRSKLLQPRSASEPTLTTIRPVYMTPDGRVESKDDDLIETLQRDAEVLDTLRSPKSAGTTLAAIPKRALGQY